MELTSPQRNITRMIAARVPLPVVSRLETVVAEIGGTRTDFVVDAIQAALERHEVKNNGAGAGSELVLQ